VLWSKAAKALSTWPAKGATFAGPDVSSTRPGDFLSTVRTTAARPGQLLDVVVLSSDAGLLEVLRDAAGSEHALWDAPSADSAVDHLVGGRCDVLIADLGSLRGDVAELIVRLQAQFPEVIVMATGRREEEGAVGALISSGQIYRFLHKPVSPARAGQFLNAATRRYNELRDIQPVALQTVRMIARKRPFLSKALLAAAGSGVLAAVIAFGIWYSQDTSLPATMQTTHVGDVPVEDVIKTKLGSAQIAQLSGRLIDPRGDNALEYYKAVLALQPENAEAKAGMQKVIDTLEQRVVKSLQERNPARVVKAWAALQRAAPDHPRLDALRNQLLALSRTSAKPPGSNVANAAPPGTLAVAPVASAPSSAAGNEQAERELAEAIARELADQEAAAAATAERAAMASTEQASSVAEEVPSATALGESTSLIAPAENNAIGTVAPDLSEKVVQAAGLQRVREVPPVYPREAARAGTEGWVQVEFTIAPDGTTRDLQVLDSAPKLVFDRAALDSVSKWRFVPIRKNGAPVPQRAVLQVRFVLNN
jgi:TonB family protein